MDYVVCFSTTMLKTKIPSENKNGHKNKVMGWKNEKRHKSSKRHLEKGGSTHKSVKQVSLTRIYIGTLTFWAYKPTDKAARDNRKCICGKSSTEFSTMVEIKVCQLWTELRNVTG